MRALLLLVLFFSAPGMADTLRVFTSVGPLQGIVEQIGGAHVDVRSMVRPGYNPQTYDPTPQQIAALAGAVLYIRAGVPFEDAWMQRLRSANRAMQVLDARQALQLSRRATHGHAHAGHGHAFDPHFWTSPPLVRQLAGVIRDRLSELDPARATEYARNHDALVNQLDTLDREIHALLDPLPNRRFLVFHPAWGYFADTYDLEQVSIQRQGQRPGARALTALIEQARSEGIRVVFVQPQFDRRQATQVAQAIGGDVIAVDPLAADYIDNLRRVARQFAEALRP